MLNIDEEQAREAFKVAIKEQVTSAIRDATITNEVRDLIKNAFMKKWGQDRDNWIEASAKKVLSQAMWSAVQEVIEESGVKDMMRQCVKEHIESDDFKAALMRRTIETVEETTFYVKPSEESES